MPVNVIARFACTLVGTVMTKFASFDTNVLNAYYNWSDITSIIQFILPWMKITVSFSLYHLLDEICNDSFRQKGYRAAPTNLKPQLHDEMPRDSVT